MYFSSPVSVLFNPTASCAFWQETCGVGSSPRRRAPSLSVPHNRPAGDRYLSLHFASAYEALSMRKGIPPLLCSNRCAGRVDGSGWTTPDRLIPTKCPVIHAPTLFALVRFAAHNVNTPHEPDLLLSPVWTRSRILRRSRLHAGHVYSTAHVYRVQIFLCCVYNCIRVRTQTKMPTTKVHPVEGW
ncbi:hypothetical protein BV20DRAFT_190804 [Pilatotrama ljubarskyi]|nr:hypothetical protein BV20DRAFT_190804 [Pilatotrama ljubarskyi]